PAERGEAVQGLLEDGAAGHLEDHVHRAAVILCFDRGGPAWLRIIDGGIGPEARDEVAFRLGAGGADDAARAIDLGELHGEYADTAGRAFDQNALAWLQPGAAFENQRSGEALDDERERLGRFDALRHGQEIRRVGDGPFRIAALAEP